MTDFKKLTAVKLVVLYLIGQSFNLAASQSSTTATPDAKTKRFHDAIMSCTDLCQFAVRTCLNATSQVRYLMAKERYCDVINLTSEGVVIRQCLTQVYACTQSEFNVIKAAACSGAKSMFVLALSTGVVTLSTGVLALSVVFMALSMVVMALCFSCGCVFQ